MTCASHDDALRSVVDTHPDVAVAMSVHDDGCLILFIRQDLTTMTRARLLRMIANAIDDQAVRMHNVRTIKGRAEP